MARVRRTKKKRRTHIKESGEGKHPPPRSFVFAFGKHRAMLKALESDLRNLMSPFTASSLRVSRNNVFKDFVHAAGALNVTHMMLLTNTDKASYLRLCKIPRGPTASLKIKEYSLCRDVQQALARPRCPTSAFQCPPLVVLNGFGASQHLKLTGVLFQNMFPSININSVKITQCQRVVLLSYNAQSDTISLRHYTVSLKPAGLTKGVKAMLTNRNVPDLSRFASVAEFVEKAGYESDSDAEDSKVVVKKTKSQQSSRVKLHEIGPRMELELVKIQEGLADGKVLYHRYEYRTEEEAANQQMAVEDRARLRAERRRQQEENVRRKAFDKNRELPAQQAKKSKKGESSEKGRALGSFVRLGENDWFHEEAACKDDDNDEAYYEQEVGVKPDHTFGKNLQRGHDVRGKKKLRQNNAKKKPKQA